MNDIPIGAREQLLDDLNQSPYGTSRDHAQDTHMEKCVVESYDATTHTAEIRPARCAPGDTIQVRVQSEFVGAGDGQGRAAALHHGQAVSLIFGSGISSGLRSSGEILGSVFVPNGAKSPAYAPYHQDGTGVVIVYGGEDGASGTAEHMSSTSVFSKTKMGRENIEDWSHSHTVIGGENTPHAETQIRDSAAIFKAAAKKLGLVI